MLAYELIEYYSFVLNKTKEFMETMKIPLDLIKNYTELSEMITKTIAESSTAQTTNGLQYASPNKTNLKSAFEQMLLQLKSNFSFLDPAMKLISIKTEITQYEDTAGITKNSTISKFLSSSDLFLKLYQTYIQKSTSKNAIEFIKELTELNYSYNCVQEIYSSTVSLLGNKEISTDDLNKVMSLQFLDIDFSFDDFTNRLVTLNKVYVAFGHILYPKAEFQKIEIIKIESGSWLSAILGDENILSAIGLFLTKAIETGFNKFTKEGQLLRHSELVDAISNDTEICKKFEDMGCNMEDAKNNLAETFTQATKGVLLLSQSSPRIKLNNIEFNYKDVNRQKYIEAVQSPLLMNSNEAPSEGE